MWRVGRGLGPGCGRVVWCYVWIICVDGRSRYLYIVPRRIPAHVRCSQCSILLQLFDICFLPCICLWQISPNPDLFVCCCRTCISLDITRIYEIEL